MTDKTKIARGREIAQAMQQAIESRRHYAADEILNAMTPADAEALAAYRSDQFERQLSLVEASEDGAAIRREVALMAYRQTLLEAVGLSPSKTKD